MLNQLTKIFRILDPEDRNIEPVYIHETISSEKGWEIVKDFSPLSWGLGINFYGAAEPYSYSDRKDTWIGISIDVGPWLFSISKYWRTGNDDE